MSLDYIFVKAIGPTSSLEEFEEDKSFRLNEYKMLGAKLFPGISWNSRNSARLLIQRSFLEVETSEASLTVRVRGPEADPEVVFKLASQCQDDNVVVIDAQTSVPVTADGPVQSAEEYNAWYRSVLDHYD